MHGFWLLKENTKQTLFKYKNYNVMNKTINEIVYYLFMLYNHFHWKRVFVFDEIPIPYYIHCNGQYTRKSK